ncbi:hypothetical protein RB195_005243 [Necator americanus]|uniref:Uncharacterized protein n=1 Tax=Necator americanus TaxID=51031 RepID=A0ABR1BLX3_NECAM
MMSDRYYLVFGNRCGEFQAGTAGRRKYSVSRLASTHTRGTCANEIRDHFGVTPCNSPAGGQPRRSPGALCKTSPPPPATLQRRISDEQRISRLDARGFNLNAEEGLKMTSTTILNVDAQCGGVSNRRPHY